MLAHVRQSYEAHQTHLRGAELSRISGSTAPIAFRKLGARFGIRNNRLPQELFDRMLFIQPVLLQVAQLVIPATHDGKPIRPDIRNCELQRPFEPFAIESPPWPDGPRNARARISK